MKKSGLIALIRRYLIAGLLVWLPLLVTFIVLRFIVNILDKSLELLPQHYQPSEWGLTIPGIGVLFSIIVLFATGILVTNFLGNKLMGVWEHIVKRIPFVNTIYTGVKQVLTTLLSSNEQSFRKVMLVEYPRRGLWHIAFLTGQNFAAAEQQAGEPVYTLFIPTTPNPTSGFLIIAPCSDVIELNLSIDDALKMIISLGVVRPQAVDSLSPVKHEQ